MTGHEPWSLPGGDDGDHRPSPSTWAGWSAFAKALAHKALIDLHARMRFCPDGRAHDTETHDVPEMPGLVQLQCAACGFSYLINRDDYDRAVAALDRARPGEG